MVFDFVIELGLFLFFVFDDFIGLFFGLLFLCFRGELFLEFELFLFEEECFLSFFIVL